MKTLDEDIWREELDGLVPETVFDVHTHVYDWGHAQRPDQEPAGWQSLGARYPVSSRSLLDAVDAVLLPGRRVNRLSFGLPFLSCDFDRADGFTASEISEDGKSAALMVVRPEMGEDRIEAQLEKYGFVGFKPYRYYSATGDAVECGITDFLPERQIAVADRHGLIVMLHLSKRKAIADTGNLDDLERLSERYPRVRWVLAHCGRSYYDRPLMKAAKRLERMPGLHYEISSVCDTDAMDVLFSIAGPGRIMYGSDDLPVGIQRGKYITFGHAWTELNETNHRFNLSHCRPEMTFVRYEMLRALARVFRRRGFGDSEKRKVFCDNAALLVSQIKG